MWPLSILARRRDERHRKAALIVLLGAYMVHRLDAADRARVEREVTDNYRRSPEPPAVWRKYASWDVVAAEQAAAMERLGIESMMPGYPWSELFAPWVRYRSRFPFKDCDLRPPWVALQFLPMSRATADAKRLLRQNEFDIPEESPWGLGALDPIDSTQAWLRTSGLYARWWKAR